MTRVERRLLKDHIALCDQLVVSLNVFAEHFKAKPIGFSTLHLLITAQNLLTPLRVYSHENKQKLKYAPRKKTTRRKKK